MTINLANYDHRSRKAVAHFWRARKLAAHSQVARGTTDTGGRSAVTAGKNMDGFLPLIEAVLRENGLGDAVIKQDKRVRTLPGYFRPTKNWDYVVTYRDRLVAALELKSQVGSFGNNFNNRCEEALGNATDFWTAYREGGFGTIPRPFLGFLMLMEDCPASRTPVAMESSVFPAFPVFENTSYADRYALLARRLVHENLYSEVALILSVKDAPGGAYTELSSDTGMKRFIAAFASAAATAAVTGND